jgi:hypothetical protein
MPKGIMGKGTEYKGKGKLGKGKGKAYAKGHMRDKAKKKGGMGYHGKD